MNLERLQILITGQVQGVGFRPHVYSVAHQLGLTGWVQNNASGVLIEIQGQSTDHFLSKLMMDLPPLAKIHHVQTNVISENSHENTFHIIESQAGVIHAIIPPDTSICSDCLTELFDPKNRYYHYPFLNCTHCGPRLTITHNLPYDRCHTSMNEFPLCEKCNEDYSNPNNRRYHAQPTACAQCGPQLSTPVDEIAQCIARGEIVALKGLGGYQLICDARNENAILKLRKRKNREAKPFAIMVANLSSAEHIVELCENAKNLLMSKERPVVLLREKTKFLPETIAPGLSHLGIMLPCTPLHYLLFNTFAGSPDGCQWLEENQAAVLIVTSANLGGNPLIIDEDAAQSELKNIADKIISYHRNIVVRMDDSVMHIINGAPFFIRRARGYVPSCIKLAHSIPSTLAVGGHLKNTFCITRGDEAFVSQHIGSLNNKETIDFFHESLDHLLNFLNVKPERIAHDLHPDFYTTQFAQAYGIPAFAIQHHHAHFSSVAAEHHIQEPAFALVLDGYGYGTDGQALGGELFLSENTTCKPLGSFYPLPQAGGDIAAREPWRMAAGVLHILGKAHEIAHRFSDQPQAAFLMQLFEKKMNIPHTSSCGRLFDAASALLGINNISQYEGQAAMQLESLVTVPEILPNGWQVDHGHFSMLPTLAYLSHVDPVSGANLFHGTLIAGLSQWIFEWAQKQSINIVLLSGGCFLNKVLTKGLINALTNYGLTPLLSRQLPPNDGSISLGQAWIAGRM